MMLDHLVKAKDELVSYWENEDISRKRPLPKLFKEREWKLVENVRDVLQQIVPITKLLGGEKYATASVILPSLLKVKKQMEISEFDSNIITTLKTTIFEEFNRRVYEHIDIQKLHLATALDIRFKNLKSIPKIERAKV